MSIDRPASRILRRSLTVAVLGVVLVLIAAILFSRQVVFAAPEQPLPFSHSRHTAAGVQCLFCHSSAARSDVAGIPSVARCMGCHETIAVERPPIQQLAGYWERQEPIPWEPVTAHWDFVFFSHMAHLQAAVSCESCHGPVGSMVRTHAVEDMDMGFCLDCHLKQPEQKVARLADCLACHK